MYGLWNLRTDGPTDRWTDGWTDGRTDGRTDGWVAGRNVCLLFYFLASFCRQENYYDDKSYSDTNFEQCTDKHQATT